jgi:uncharacterized protein (TIGR02145 family)
MTMAAKAMAAMAMTAMAASVIAFASCDDKKKPEPVAVTSVVLDEETLELEVNETIALEYTVHPEAATDKTVTWTSEYPETVKVEDGVITALKAGHSTITVTTNDGKKTDFVEVTVEDDSVPYVKARSVELDKYELELAVGGSAKLTATVLPEGNSNNTLMWKNLTPDVAAIDENGDVTVLGPGIAAIVAVVIETDFDEELQEEFQYEITATCEVRVKGTYSDQLGAVSFRTPSTWTVGGVEWSDYVTATGCQKSDYDGGYYIGDKDYAVNIDCRQNFTPGMADYFSWAAVYAYEEALCPAGWRMPVFEDLVALNVALGGLGVEQNTYDDETGEPSEQEAAAVKALSEKYISDWGGEYAGFTTPGNKASQGAEGYIWSTTTYSDEYNKHANVHTTFYSEVQTSPISYLFKGVGLPVRCIKED